MATLTDSQIAGLIEPYLGDLPVPARLCAQLSTYLDLLLKWNARTNLTSIREPNEIVKRHFGESLFTGVHLASRVASDGSLLDLGSGAGFPGLPIQLLLPHLTVTLAESQNKKATFLREVIRTLQLPTSVHAARAETLPPHQAFDVVTLRAVDNMPAALEAALPRIKTGGWLAVLGTEPFAEDAVSFPLPNAARTSLYLRQAT